VSSSFKPGLVSVIVASYNHAEFLQERMDSLLNQTYKNIEIIVIDDCSTDNSREVLRQYKPNQKVRLIERDSNSGWVSVSNQGVALSQGEFIIFANCDDACDSGMIVALVDSLQKNPTAGISFCCSELIDSSGNRLGSDFDQRERSFRAKCARDVLLTRGEMTRFLMHSCVIPNLSAALFRKNTYILSGGLTSKYQVCADWDLFFNVTKKCEVFYISQALNYFRQHETTIRSSTKERKYLLEIIEIILSNIKLQKSNFYETSKYRLNAMYILAEYALRPRFDPIINFPYLMLNVLRLDWMAIVLLPPAFALRFCNVACKVFKGTGNANSQ